MLILKHYYGRSNYIEKEFKTIEEALNYDYHVWNILGENCDFYYKNNRLVLDTINLSKEKITEVIMSLIQMYDDMEE